MLCLHGWPEVSHGEEVCVWGGCGTEGGCVVLVQLEAPVEGVQHGLQGRGCGHAWLQ